MRNAVHGGRTAARSNEKDGDVLNPGWAQTENPGNGVGSHMGQDGSAIKC